MTSALRKIARDEMLRLSLDILDPAGALVAGMFTLHYTIAAWIALLHREVLYGPSAALIVWGVVLILSNVRVPIALLVRGFGSSSGATRDGSLGSLLFLVGFGLLAASQQPKIILWINTALPSSAIIGTSLTILATVFAFVTSLFEGTIRMFKVLKASGDSILKSSANRSRHKSLEGQLTLCAGEACGVFRERNVVAGAPKHGELLLYDEQSARRGTIAIGIPGSSKTRSKIYPDLYWALQSAPTAGALVFVTKRRATQDCYAVARAFRNVDVIHVVGVGAGRAHMNITAGMTHESIGDAIKDGLGASHSDFWIHGPSAFVEGFIEIAQALAPAIIHVPEARDDQGNVAMGDEAYDLNITDTLPTFLKLISLDVRRLDAVFSFGFTRAADLEGSDPQKARILRELLHEAKERILPLIARDAKLGEELRQSVLPQLQPFARGALCDAFCDPNGIDLALLEKGHVILVEIDETEHPRAAATVIRMIFRRIVQMARERTASNRVGSLNPIVLLCDEYTNYAAPGHVQAWNTVRESNFCPTIGITSLSALIKQLGGDRDAASAIIANFANKFFFENDDKATRDLARELVGHAVVTRHGKTEGKSKSSGGAAGSRNSTSTTMSKSLNEQLEDVLDGRIWRTLGAEREYAKAIGFVRTPQGVRTDVVALGVLDPTDRITTALPEAYGLRP